MPDWARATGSRVIVTSSSRPPVISTSATPEIPSSSGTIWSLAICPSSLSVAVSELIAAMTTGEALRLRAETAGSTPSGSVSEAIASSIAAVASSTSVPYSNWAVMKPIELAEVDRTWSIPETDCTARSIGATTWSATSSAEAPGNGAMTVATGNETSGRSSCFRLPQAMTPKMKSPTASRMVTLRRSTAARVSQVMSWIPYRVRRPHRSAA